MKDEPEIVKQLREEEKLRLNKRNDPNQCKDITISNQASSNYIFEENEFQKSDSVKKSEKVKTHEFENISELGNLNESIKEIQ